jgi:hypothetical protein
MNNHLMGIISMHPPPIYYSIDPPFTHNTLYQFWVRSEGLWLSKLAKVTLRFLDEQELQTFRQHHSLTQPEFGVRMAWEYQTKTEVGQMMWCVDAAQSGLVFANQGITDRSPPAIYHYQLVNDLTLVTTNGEAEERTILDGDSRRLRELRTGGKLVKRLWENRYSA